MNKIFFFSLTILLLLVSCSQTDKELPRPNYNKSEIDQIIDEHLENSLVVFQDSIDSKSGFLGWRNIRDYVGLGSEDFSERTLATWYKVYDNKSLEYKIQENLVSEKSVEIEINKADEHISQYIHKISLSFTLLIIEGVFEFLLTLFFGQALVAVASSIFIWYQFTHNGWINWSKPRRNKLEEMVAITSKIVPISIVLLTVLFGLISGNFSDTVLSEKIKSDIKNDISAQIEQKI